MYRNIRSVIGRWVEWRVDGKAISMSPSTVLACNNKICGIYICKLSNNFVIFETISYSYSENARNWWYQASTKHVFKTIMQARIGTCLNINMLSHQEIDLKGNYIVNNNYQITLAHWGRVVHICVGNLTIIVSDNGQWQTFIWTNVRISSIGP